MKEISGILQTVRSGSDAVLHISRIEFIELSSCEERRQNQFETADIIPVMLDIPSKYMHYCLVLLYEVYCVCKE